MVAGLPFVHPELEPKCKFYYCVKGTDHADAKAKTATFQKAMAEITGTDK